MADRRDSRIALRFIILIGILSFFADFTYEGSRSIVGPYLATLQATGTIVGIVTGFRRVARLRTAALFWPLGRRYGSLLANYNFWVRPANGVSARACADRELARCGRAHHSRTRW